MEVTVAQAGVDLLFCNSFLQHNPTPLAGHRQEKTAKMRFEQEKTDGSAEPSVQIGMPPEQQPSLARARVGGLLHKKNEVDFDVAEVF